MTWQQVCDAIEEGLAVHENREPYSILHSKRKYSLRCTRIAYKQEKALQAHESRAAKQREALFKSAGIPLSRRHSGTL